MAQSLAAAGQNLERRTVVSVLLFPHKPYASKPYRVLLFRRSDKVSTYRRKLAPIAGSVETYDQSPLQAAWRELREETSFGPQQIELWRRGAGFEFTDRKAVVSDEGERKVKGRIWKVWPFAFRLTAETADYDNDVEKLGLQMNFEHLGCQWQDVDDVLSGRILDDCVPRLEMTLGQVWVEPDSVLYQGLEELRLDHSHGARELATMAVKSLIRIVEHDQQAPQQHKDADEWWKGLQRQAFHLAFNGRPSMAAAISNAVAAALKEAKTHIDPPPPDFIEKVRQSLEASVANRAEISKQVSLQFSKFLQERFRSSSSAQAHAGEKGRHIKILTLSSSSTIKAAVIHALEADETLSLELRILESRPLNEGVSFAKFLTDEAQRRRAEGLPPLDERLRVVLASDASVGVLSRDVDLVVIGADRISEAGDVSNKTGSLAAALVSKAVTNGKAVVVCVSESEKIAAPGAAGDHAEEDNDTAELTGSWDVQEQQHQQESSSLWDKMVTVRNVYFEWVPAQHIDYFVCEVGTLSTQDIRQRSQQIGEVMNEVFTVEQGVNVSEPSGL
ncbi:uncharacterized protein Z520_00893 [Fonsecaea multimorphosa CBS 102226]|uniref:Nudix hydrolase domain-containing protein n=1 Tax=Fonsecaea multimorphosa CBS 102226 TaxID=1442371 RepID=A0A0D2KL32_9EURO|nr:uncharacterized protein Z520_00893 [Fonsecaea multimorphosa CBS 102226]KIY04200.1 hypothetical protein Z520_00893 [Fonsecaea multimorphosa CBS 102226]OAL32029.1 hypothetical protein AYO22_00899 [Fonsecaea multimorphosa]